MRRLSLSRRLLFSALIAGTLLVCLEFSARALEPPAPAQVEEPAPQSMPPRSPLYFQQFSGRPMLEDAEELARFHGLEPVAAAPDLGVLPNPWTGRVVLTHEWLDLGGQSVLRDKPEDEIRIVFLGGSAVGGWGLPIGATAVGIVERLLDRASPDQRVRVLNLARTGFGSAQLAWVLEQVGPALQPDLVVTVMGNNERLDVAASVYARQDDPAEVERLTGFGASDRDSAATGTSLEAPWLQKLFEHLALARLLRGKVEPLAAVVLPAGDGGGEVDVVMPLRDKLKYPEKIDHFALARLEQTLGSLAATSQALGAQLLVNTVPVNVRYNSSEHEWFFFGPEQFRSEPYRTAHWAYYYDAPKAGAAAMRERLAEVPDELSARLLLGHFLKVSGQLEEATGHLQQVIDALDASANQSQQGSGIEWSSETQLMYAWAVRELHGTEAAVELVAPWIRSWREERHRNMGTDTCPVSNLLYYAGDVDAARSEYQDCLLDAYYYRAGPAINGQLLQLAERLGAERYDLAADVAGRSPGQLPGYELFLDYCHYNPRGNLLVGHLLAARIAAVLGLAGELETPESALQRYDTRRAGRITDLPELDEWVGANFDVTYLTSDRHGENSHFVRTGEAGSALAKVFQGNEFATGRYRCFGQCECHCSPRFGMRSHHEELPDAAAQAARLYRQAFEQDPGLAAAMSNIEDLRTRLQAR